MPYWDTVYPNKGYIVNDGFAALNGTRQFGKPQTPQFTGIFFRTQRRTLHLDFIVATLISPAARTTTNNSENTRRANTLDQRLRGRVPYKGKLIGDRWLGPLAEEADQSLDVLGSRRQEELLTNLRPANITA